MKFSKQILLANHGQHMFEVGASPQVGGQGDDQQPLIVGAVAGNAFGLPGVDGQCLVQGGRRRIWDEKEQLHRGSVRAGPYPWAEVLSKLPDYHNAGDGEIFKVGGVGGRKKWVRSDSPSVAPEAQGGLAASVKEATGGQPLRAQRGQLGQFQFAAETGNATAGVEALDDGLRLQAGGHQPPRWRSIWRGDRLTVTVSIYQTLQPGSQRTE